MASDLLAALLSSRRVQSLASGSTLPCVSPKTVTLPRLPDATGRAGGEHLAYLDGLEANAYQLIDCIGEARDAPVEGLETGAPVHLQ
jgi:hypothetical protein